MKLTKTTAGLALLGVAGLMLGTAVLAGGMGGGHGRHGGMGMQPPALDLGLVDTDKDGKISKEELEAYRVGRIKAADANGDGSLSVDELAEMQFQALRERTKSIAQKMLSRLDSDGDGFLSAAEMAKMEAPMELFDRADGNADGFLDQAEIDAARGRVEERHGWKGRQGDHAGGDAESESGN